MSGKDDRSTAHAIGRSPTLRLIAGSIVSAALALGMSAHARTLTKIAVPKPLSSDDLARLEKAGGVSDAERPAVEAAFDEYLQAWQRIRSKTLRPLRAAVDEAIEKSSEGPDALPPGVFEQLRGEARQAYARLARIDDAFFTALRAGTRTPEQLQAIDAAQRSMHARIAAATMHTLCDTGDTSALLSPIPSLPDGLDAAAHAAVARRLEQLDRDSLPRLDRITANALSDTGDSRLPFDEAQAVMALRLKAIDEIGSMLPPSTATDWVDGARNRMLRASNSRPMRYASVPRSVMATVLGDGIEPATRTRLERWYTERRRLEDQALQSVDVDSRRDIERQLDALEQAALNDLAKATGTRDLSQRTSESFKKWAGEHLFKGPDAPLAYDDEDGTELAVDRQARTRTTAAAGAGDGAASMASLGMTRGIRRPQVDRIRDALGVTADQRATWDALANDVIDSSDALNRERGLQTSLMANGPKMAVESLDRMRDHRAAQQELEERWFDSIAAALPAVSKDRLNDQRTRRALQRLRESAGVVQYSARQAGDRWMDIDLDAVLSRLSDDSRARVAEAAAACRARCMRELQQAIDQLEASARELFAMLADMAGDAEPSEEKRARIERASDKLRRTAAELSKQSRLAMQQDLESMASKLSGQAGEPLRRAMRREQYPEVFRPLERFDDTIDRVMSLPDLRADQMTAISTDADAFRARSEEMADQAMMLIDAVTAAQAKLEDIRRKNPSDASMQAFARSARNRAFLASADAEFDRDELMARTMRRLRANLTAAQAETAKIGAAN